MKKKGFLNGCVLEMYPVEGLEEGLDFEVVPDEGDAEDFAQCIMDEMIMLKVYVQLTYRGGVLFLFILWRGRADF